MTTLPRHNGRMGRTAVSRGLSIVELMVGIAIGLFILAGATLVMTTQLGENRRLLLEAQIQQDLRTTADLISRDIRRAGYWGQAYQQVWPVAGAVPNPYVRFTERLPAQGSTQVEYDRSTDEEGGVALIGTDDNLVDAVTGRPRERVGFQFNATNGTIDYLIGSWQALTDPAVMRVTRFDLTFDKLDANEVVPCGAACPAVGVNGCPLKQTYRIATITIIAEAVHDATVRRSITDSVRLRNPIVREVCPP